MNSSLIVVQVFGTLFAHHVVTG